MASPTAPPRPFRAAGATEAMRAAALGANAWVVALVLPVIHGGARDAADVVLTFFPLVPLAVGAAALRPPVAGRPAVPEDVRRAPARRDRAVSMLLFAFPVALAAVIAARADLADRDAWGPLGLFVGSVSLLAYGAVAIEACGRPLRLRTSTAQGLGTPLVAHEPPLRTWLRRAVLATATLGGLLVAVVAPAAGSRVELVRAWRDAADEATVLASIVGAGASALALAALIGPRLRAPRQGEVPIGSGALRMGAAITIAVLALVAYALLRRFEEG